MQRPSEIGLSRTDAEHVLSICNLRQLTCPQPLTFSHCDFFLLAYFHLQFGKRKMLLMFHAPTRQKLLLLQHIALSRPQCERGIVKACLQPKLRRRAASAREAPERVLTLTAFMGSVLDGKNDHLCTTPSSQHFVLEEIFLSGCKAPLDADGQAESKGGGAVLASEASSSTSLPQQVLPRPICAFWHAE